MPPLTIHSTRRASVGFMFLGGPLDHTIRTIERDGIDPRQPAVLYHEHTPAGLQHLTYNATRCASGTTVWWCFVLDGYNPPVSHLLDANPFYI